MAMAVSRGRAAALGNDWSDFLSLCKASCFMPDISTTSSTALDGVDGATLPAATDTTAFDTAIQSVQEQPENEAGASPDSDGQATGDAAPASDGQATVVLWDDIVADLVAGATGHNNVTNSDPAPATVTDTAESNKAEVYRKLRSALAENMRENATSPGQLDGISDDQVLAELTQVPDPFSTDDDKIHEAMLDVMRDLYAALDLYGGKEGEEGVSPAQTKLVYGQLLLALTQDIDWETVLAAPAAEGGVTFDGVVLHGATTMTLAAAAAAIKDKIRTALVANELGNWATNMTDRIAPVLIGDPTLFLEPPSETILYGSLQWAQLRLGFEFAAEQGLDPANLTADQILALGRATMTKPAPTTGEAGADATVDQEDADATATRTTRALLLIGQAFGDLDAATIASGTEEQIEEAFDKAARHAFPEDYALIDALDAISAEMPERKKLAAEYLTSAHKEPHEVYHYMTFAAGHAIYNTTTLADYYFENDTVHEIDGLPKLSESFEAKFGEYKSNYANGMATIIENRLADYAAEHDFDLNGGTTWVSVRRPALNASKQTPRLEGGVNLQKMDPIYSNTHLIIEMVEKERDTPRRLLLNLEKLDEGLQEIPLDAASTWVMEHRKEYFAQAQLDLFDQKLADGAVPNDDPSKLEPEIASKLHSQLSAAIVDFYDKEIEGYHKSARGQTFGESVGEFFLNLIPFRAMIVAIQDGKPGEAILNGLLDIVSFIPFVGEAAKAVQIGSKALSAGIAAALRATAQKGLAAALAGGLRATASLGREFGWQLLKTAATGLENALPIPTPGLSSKIGAAGAKDMVRVIDNVKAADTALGEALESLGRRNSLIDIADGGSWQLASDLKVSKNAKGADVIELDAIKLSLSEKKSIDLDDITLTVGEDLNGEPLFLKEHGVGAEAFYTLIDPSTGTSYGKRFTFDDAGWLFAGSAKIGRLGVTAGSTGNETVNGSTGDETVTGANGNINGDTVDGSEGGGNDTAIGSTGDQAVTGTDGDINGGTTNDKTALYEALTNALLDYEAETPGRGDAPLSLNEALAHYVSIQQFGIGIGDLMQRLARASGLYEDGVTASDLSEGQRYELVNLLLRAVTKDIDWQTVLGRDANAPNDVWYDGVTLRNATSLSIKDASTAIRQKVMQALDPQLTSSARAILAYELTEFLIADPTLSLAPPPEDIKYGSRDWAKLWTGMDAAKEINFTTSLTQQDLLALGQTVMLKANSFSGGDGKPQSDPNGSTSWNPAAIALMARAAGKLDDLEFTPANAEALSEKLNAFRDDEFRDEITLMKGATDLSGFPQNVPSLDSVAKEQIALLGLDPNMKIKIDELIPFATWGLGNGSPLSAEHFNTKTRVEALWSLYAQHGRDGLLLLAPSVKDLAALKDKITQLPDQKAVKGILGRSFREFYYDATERIARCIAASLNIYEKNNNFDWSKSTIEISQIFMPSAREMTFSEKYLYNYALSVEDAPLKTYENEPPGISRIVATSLLITVNGKKYLLDGVDSIGSLVPLPDKWEDWVIENRYCVLNPVNAQNYKDPPPHLRPTLSTVVSSEKDGLVKLLTEAFRRKVDEIEDKGEWEQVDAILGIIPFYSAIKSFVTGEDVAGGVISLYLDILSFIPTFGQGLKLVAAGGKAIEVAATQGWKAAAPLMDNVTYRVGKFGYSFLDDAIGGLPKYPKLVRALSSADVQDLAKFSTLNDGLSTTLNKTAETITEPAKVEDAVWTIKLQKEAGGTERISDAPLYLTAADAQGNKLKLLHLSDNAYVQYDPVTLEPFGPILQPDATGRLYKSIDAAALPRYAVGGDVWQQLVGKTADENGIIWLNNERYANLFDDTYVKLEADSVTDEGRRIWRVANPADTGVADSATAPRLLYDSEKDVWLGKPAGALVAGERPAQADLPALMNALGTRTILNIPDSGLAGMTRVETLDREKVASLVLTPASGRQDDASKATFYPLSQQPVGNKGDIALKGYWAPFKNSQTAMDYVDVPVTNPNYDYVFTAPMNGCSLIITKPDKNTLRVWHLNDGTDLKKRAKRLEGAGIRESDIIDEISFDEYGTATDFTSFTGMAYDKANGSWNFFSQRQHLRDDGKTLEAAKGLIHRPVDLATSDLSAAQITNYRVAKPTSLNLAPGAPPALHQGKKYIMVKSATFQVEEGADKTHCWIVDPNNASAPKIAMESDGFAWRLDADIANQNAATSLSDLSAMERAAYKLEAQPVVLAPDPDNLNIFRSEQGRFVKIGDDWFAVKQDGVNGSWMIYSRDNSAKSPIRIRYENGQWWRDDSLELKGGVQDPQNGQTGNDTSDGGESPGSSKGSGDDSGFVSGEDLNELIASSEALAKREEDQVRSRLSDEEMESAISMEPPADPPTVKKMRSEDGPYFDYNGDTYIEIAGRWHKVQVSDGCRLVVGESETVPMEYAGGTWRVRPEKVGDQDVVAILQPETGILGQLEVEKVYATKGDGSTSTEDWDWRIKDPNSKYKDCFVDRTAGEWHLRDVWQPRYFKFDDGSGLKEAAKARYLVEQAWREANPQVTDKSLKELFDRNWLTAKVDLKDGSETHYVSISGNIKGKIPQAAIEELENSGYHIILEDPRAADIEAAKALYDKYFEAQIKLFADYNAKKKPEMTKGELNALNAEFDEFEKPVLAVKKQYDDLTEKLFMAKTDNGGKVAKDNFVPGRPVSKEYVRELDTEPRVLHTLDKEITALGDRIAGISLYSELEPCASCETILLLFKKRLKENNLPIKVDISYSFSAAGASPMRIPLMEKIRTAAKETLTEVEGKSLTEKAKAFDDSITMTEFSVQNYLGQLSTLDDLRYGSKNLSIPMDKTTIVNGITEYTKKGTDIKTYYAKGPSDLWYEVQRVEALGNDIYLVKPKNTYDEPRLFRLVESNDEPGTKVLEKWDFNVESTADFPDTFAMEGGSVPAALTPYSYSYSYGSSSTSATISNLLRDSANSDLLYLKLPNEQALCLKQVRSEKDAGPNMLFEILSPSDKKPISPPLCCGYSPSRWDGKEGGQFYLTGPYLPN
jgi:hypothetical protein